MSGPPASHASPPEAAPGPAPETLAPYAGPPPAAAAQPGLRERGRLRRRVRYLRKLRELELRDLGGLVFTMYRFSSKRQDLVRDKLKVMFEHDAELRDLEGRLGDPRRTVEVREPGIGGTCPACGALHSSDARFCSQCGRPVGKDAGPAPAPEVWAPDVTPAAPADPAAPPVEPRGPNGEAAAMPPPAEPDTESPTTEIRTARQ